MTARVPCGPYLLWLFGAFLTALVFTLTHCLLEAL
jgi:hypothetical protein